MDEKKKEVALVLSSGGARGFAHIGAIEALEERGYRIVSVAGASMGALIGGAYCTGRLGAVKDWLYSLTRREVLALIDWSVGRNHLVKGERLMGRLKKLFPDRAIDELDLPLRIVAADLTTQREVVFRKGSLYRALRASIAMPTVLKPLRVADHILVDGGIVNPLPLNRAVRREGDLLVAVNVSAPASDEVEALRAAAHHSGRKSQPWTEWMAAAIAPGNAASNYLTLLASAMALQIQRHTVQTLKLYPPDVAANIPMNRFGVFDFDHAPRIVRAGYEAMNQALDTYEQGFPANDSSHPAHQSGAAEARSPFSGQEYGF